MNESKLQSLENKSFRVRLLSLSFRYLLGSPDAQAPGSPVCIILRFHHRQLAKSFTSDLSPSTANQLGKPEAPPWTDHDRQQTNHIHETTSHSRSPKAPLYQATIADSDLANQHLYHLEEPAYARACSQLPSSNPSSRDCVKLLPKGLPLVCFQIHFSFLMRPLFFQRHFSLLMHTHNGEVFKTKKLVTSHSWRKAGH